MRRKMKICCEILFAAGIVFFFPQFSFGQRANVSSKVFERAADLGDLRSSGSAPFRIDASIEFSAKVGAKVEGTYTLIWASKDQWREEIHIADYSRVRVGGPGKYWQQRSIDYELLQVEQLSTALDYVTTLRDFAPYANRKVKHEKNKGIEMKCIEARPPKETAIDFCFDQTDSTVRLEKLQEEGPVFAASREYSEFANLSGKYFPKVIRVMTPGGLSTVFTATSIRELTDVDVKDFAPPAGAEVWESCDRPSKAQFMDGPKPAFPPDFMDNPVSGTFVIYAVIDKSGVPRDIKLLTNPYPKIAQAIVESVAKSRFKPMQCNGAPVPSEAFFTSEFVGKN